MKNRGFFGVSRLLLALVHRVDARLKGVSDHAAVEFALLAIGLDAHACPSKQSCSGGGEADHKEGVVHLVLLQSGRPTPATLA